MAWQAQQIARRQPGCDTVRWLAANKPDTVVEPPTAYLLPPYVSRRAVTNAHEMQFFVTAAQRRSRLDKLRVALKEIRHSRILRKQLRKIFIELQIVSDDHGDGRGHRLFNIERGERRSKPFLCFL